MTTHNPSETKRARVAVIGAGGRMGTRVIRLLVEHPTLRLGAAVDRHGAWSTSLPPEAAATSDIAAGLEKADVVIDFSAPAAVQAVAPLCAKRGIPLVLASTGLDGADHQGLQEASRTVAVLQAANLSLGVNVMFELVELAAARLAGFDIEISEIHHRHKRDAPSGTALALGEAVSRGRPGLHTVAGRAGADQVRGEAELGFSSLRGGDVAGEHTVFYFGNNERIEITHRAGGADIFATGALRAAAWLLGRPAGLYTMRDVLKA